MKKNIFVCLLAVLLPCCVSAYDFIVDGKYKVASCSSINAGDNFIYTGFHFSVNVNLEHIKNICQKPMVKIPKGLSDYGVTSNQIVEFLSSLLKEKMGENYVVQ